MIWQDNNDNFLRESTFYVRRRSLRMGSNMVFTSIIIGEVCMFVAL